MSVTRWITLVVLAAAFFVLGGAEVHDEPITLGRVTIVAGLLALAAVIANWPKRSKKFVSDAHRRVRS